MHVDTFINENDGDESLLLCHFTKNGQYCKTIKCLEKGNYYPTIGISSPGAKVKTNMGENNFLYNIPGMLDIPHIT